MNNSNNLISNPELKSVIKEAIIEHPKISIITVVYNNVSLIEETILSVINQSYSDLEYIIIDGGSTDGTVNIIEKYNDKIDFWISEPDKGLYFAMNKGLNIAKGKWVNFMNSGDSFYSLTTIEDIFSRNFNTGVVYGDVIFSFNGKNDVYVKAKSLKYFWKGMQFVHQASFVSTDLMKKYPFDTKYRIIADYNSLYQIFLLGYDFQYVGLPVCKFLAGGFSDNNPVAIAECQKMIFSIHRSFYVRIFYYFRYVECSIKFYFAKSIGQTKYAFMRRVKRKLLDIILIPQK